MSKRGTHESEAEQVVRLLKTVGLRELMGADGCWCGHTQVRGFAFDRSCHKSESSLRVYSCGTHRWPDELALVATEALRQMREEDGWSNILVRYCHYTADHFGSGYVDKVWVRGPGKCVYCAKPRDHREHYLCAACLVSNEEWRGPIAPEYDYSGITPHGMQIGGRDP